MELKDLSKELKLLASTSEQEIKKLQAKLDAEKKLSKLCSNLAEYMPAGWFCHSKEQLIKNKAFLEFGKESLTNAVREVEQTIETALNRFEVKLPKRIEESCKEKNIPFNTTTSRYPDFYFYDDVIKVSFVKKDGILIAKLASHSEKLGNIPADIPPLFDKIQLEADRIMSKAFNPESFLKKLRKAYLDTAKSAKLKDGEPVPIRELFKTYKDANKKHNIKSDEFVFALTKLMRAPVNSIDGCNISFQQTKSTKDGYLLYGKHATGYVGWVKFNKGV